MDHIVSALTAGKHIVESNDNNFYIAVDPYDRPLQLFFSMEEAQNAAEFNNFIVFSAQGKYKRHLGRVCEKFESI